MNWFSLTLQVHFTVFYFSVLPNNVDFDLHLQIPPVTNAAAHAGTNANTQFQKTYAPHMYTTKG